MSLKSLEREIVTLKRTIRLNARAGITEGQDERRLELKKLKAAAKQLRSRK